MQESKPEHLLEKYKQIAQSLVEVVGELELPQLKTIRAETDVPDYFNDAHFNQFRGILAELGFGRDTDVTPAEAGMQNGFTAMLQGGLAWKIDSEIKVATESEKAIAHGPVVLTLSPYRRITPSEQAYLHNKGIDLSEDSSELDLGIALISNQSGFAGYDYGKKVDVLFEYNPEELADGFSFEPVTNEGANNPTTMLIGYLNGQPVYVMQVLRAYNEAGKFKQPSTLVLSQLVSGLINQTTGQYPSFMANVGGATYPSLDISPEGNIIFEQASIPTILGDVKYGTLTLAGLKKGQPSPPNNANTLSEVIKFVNKFNQ
jgi:hypothetical protein